MSQIAEERKWTSFFFSSFSLPPHFFVLSTHSDTNLPSVLIGYRYPPRDILVLALEIQVSHHLHGGVSVEHGWICGRLEKKSILVYTFNNLNQERDAPFPPTMGRERSGLLVRKHVEGIAANIYIYIYIYYKYNIIYNIQVASSSFFCNRIYFIAFAQVEVSLKKRKTD